MNEMAYTFVLFTLSIDLEWKVEINFERNVEQLHISNYFRISTKMNDERWVRDASQTFNFHLFLLID